MGLSDSPFLYLLRAGLWGDLPQGDALAGLTDANWTVILDQARAHAVDALVSDGAGLLPQGQRPPFQILGPLSLAVDAIERGNQKVNAVLKPMASFWEREGVTAVLLKGQGLAGLYPKPEHRTPGDIDWFLPGKENFDRALALARAKGFAPEIDGDGDYHYSVNGVVVEHHKKWCDVSSPFKQGRISAIEKKYGYAKGQGYTLPSALTNLIQLNVHILKHVLVMGVGWRQFCDLALATVHYSGKYSCEEYAQAVGSLGLTRWTRLLYGVLSKYLGTDSSVLPVSPLAGSDVDRLAELIMQCGNFGRESGKKMLGSFASASLLLCRYVPGEVFWRPVMLAGNRFIQFFKRMRD